MSLPPSRPSWVRPPNEAQPVEADEIAFALQVGISAADMVLPAQNPESVEVLLEQEPNDATNDALAFLQSAGLISTDATGDSAAIRFMDSGFNRLASALREHFPAPEKFFSVLTRLSAYLVLSRYSEGMRDWARPNPVDPDSFLIHQAVVDVVATMPVSADGCFDEIDFFKRVDDLARTKYAAD